MTHAYSFWMIDQNYSCTVYVDDTKLLDSAVKEIETLNGLFFFKREEKRCFSEQELNAVQDA